jgi:ring-1,2-phenylacetyl-CoA epoxidase subunit PaaD
MSAVQEKLSFVAAPAAVVERVREVLAGVPDPEIPVLSVLDLGVIRAIELGGDGTLRIGVSPTYSGCPATIVIKRDVVRALERAGYDGATAFDVLSPPWTSDWISAEGHRKLREYGIAPPGADRDLACPRCGSHDTRRLSEFGSTPCKALHRCESCLEPFDRFKCI